MSTEEEAIWIKGLGLQLPLMQGVITAAMGCEHLTQAQAVKGCQI